jgi:hypothetical protein
LIGSALAGISGSIPRVRLATLLLGLGIGQRSIVRLREPLQRSAVDHADLVGGRGARAVIEAWHRSSSSEEDDPAPQSAEEQR